MFLSSVLGQPSSHSLRLRLRRRIRLSGGRRDFMESASKIGMDKEGVSENATVEMERRIKPKLKKVKKNEESTTVMQGAQGIDTVKAIEHVRTSEKEDIAEMNRVHKRDKEKKRNKGTKDFEADTNNKGVGEGELTVACGEGNSGDAIPIVAVRKTKKREKSKNKNDEFEMGKTNEHEGGECKKDSSKMNKQPKEKRKHDNGESEEREIDGNEVERKKTKRERKTSKDDNLWQESFDEAKHAEGDLSLLQKENVPDNVEGNCVGKSTKELKRKKNKNKGKKSSNADSSVTEQDSVDKDTNGPVHADNIQINRVEYANKRKKKGTKLAENSSDDTQDIQVEYASKGKKRETKIVENGSDDPISNKSNKKVTFSGQVEVFPVPGDSNTERWNVKQDNLVRGKRFTLDEDKIVKEAVYKYILEHHLGEEGLNMVLNCKKYPDVRGCWREIGSAIPYRPYTSVYFRAQVLFRRSVYRKWTPEEYEKILKYHENHDNEWKALADELGEHQKHVRNTWCRIKMRNMNKGRWSQEEYQKLFDLVNVDLQGKVSKVKRSQHGMFRDNISWTVISEQLSTRPQARCCSKWYTQLTSRMVAEGVWADSDDYRMIDALYSLDATCVEDVDWDILVEERGGDVCRRRWNQMVQHIGHHTYKSFSEQIEILAQRYCPHLLEARVAWDSKPWVP